MTNHKNILIVRTDRIGDVVLTLPLAQIIKKHYPDSRIAFLLRDYTKSLAEGNPFIDEVITLKVANGKLKFTENIKQLRNKYDTCIIVSPVFTIALILFFSKIKTRVGTGYRWYSFLFNKKIFEHRKYGEKHELEYNVRMLKQLQIDEEIDENSVAFNLHISHESEQSAVKFLSDLSISHGEKIIICHPGSGGSAVDLPTNKFKELVNKLAHNLGITVLITGSSSEVELCSQLVVNEKTINIAGKIKLEILAAIINKSEMVLANSTGPIHIAAALGKKVIGFYPKIAACSPKRWGPYTNKKIIFTPKLDCSNCTRKQCEELDCMNSIDIDEVFTSIKILLDSDKDNR